MERQKFGIEKKGHAMKGKTLKRKKQGGKPQANRLSVDLGFANVDLAREKIRGYPEVILCTGKKTEHIIKIIQELSGKNQNVLATKANAEIYGKIKKVVPHAEYSEDAKLIMVKNKRNNKKTNCKNCKGGRILVLSAGTSDIPIAEEAALTAEFFGNDVERIYDVGVAGLHRLLSKIEKIRSAEVIIVVAGMEGALPSVVAGLTDKPIIAVPTRIGYGAHFRGIAPLLAMLNSCSPGVAVMNIDNGFGAGYFASLINRK